MRFTKATRRPCAATTRKATHHPERTTERLTCRFTAAIPHFNQHDKQESFIMAKFYCKYCGNAYSSVQSLTSTTCSRHPDGVGKGRHALYEGDEAPEYTCKYCGKRASTIASLTSQMCPRHPDGNGKGRHSPSL
jgi:predicted nucleic acid-binding Zn ribbon protein